MTSGAAIEAAIAPALDRLGFELVDVEVAGAGRGRTVRVLLDREGGVDLDAITEATHAVSPILDRDDLVSGPFTLEVSSPGVERPLRRPDHFARVVGDQVTVKVRGADGAVLRHRGELVDAGPATFTVRTGTGDETMSYDDVLQARTVFEWGPAPKPGATAARGSG